MNDSQYYKRSRSSRVNGGVRYAYKSSHSLPNTEFQHSRTVSADSPFKEMSQAKLIDNCLGPLPGANKRYTGFSRFLYNKRKKEKRFISKVCQRLPPLSNAGSNMNNNINTNSSNALGSMNLEPLSNAEELINLNPMNMVYDENYHKARVFFMLSTFVTLLLMIFELAAIILGIIYTNSCQMVDVFLVVSGSFHLMILLLEWAKSWIWSSNNNPVVPDSNSDHMQIFLSCILSLLYSISGVWYIVGFAWIPNVFANFLQQNDTKVEQIIIIKYGKEYSQRIPKCSERFYIFAISYQVVVGLLFLLRLVFCCMSGFCKGLCNKFATHTDLGGFELYSENPLNDILPPIRHPLFKFGYKDHHNVTAINNLFNTEKLSMIPPIPIYPSDKIGQTHQIEPIPYFTKSHY